MMSWLTGRAWFTLVTLLGVAIFIMANQWLQPKLAGVRLDFTQRGLYTLSDATRDTLANLAEPVELTLVYSRRVGQDYPRIRSYAARVREVLSAYDAIGGAQLQFSEVEPRAFSQAEDTAISAGLTAVETDGPDPLYFGLIGRNTVDDERIIAFLAPEKAPSLEYEITRMVSRLDNPAPKRVGVLSGLPGMQGDGTGGGYHVLGELAKSFEIEPIEPDFVSLPQDLDAVLIVHPPALTPYQLWLIDQHLLRAGRLVWIADPASKAAAGAGDVLTGPPVPARSDFSALGEAWGVRLTDAAVADAANALPVRDERPDGRLGVVGQPLFIAAPPANMSDASVITGDLSRPVHFGAAGGLEAEARPGLRFEALIETGPAPSLIDARRAVGEMSPGEVIAEYTTEKAARPLAGRLSGRFETAFPGGRPDLARTGDPVVDELTRAAAAENDPEHLATATGPGIVVLVGDADFLDDGFYINPDGGSVTADNAAFLLNAVDALTGIEKLLSLRARAPGERPMIRVERLRREAEERFFAEQDRLERQLRENQSRIRELRETAAGSGRFTGDLEADLPADKRGELQRLRKDVMAARTRLREIERDYRREIDGLERVMKLVNIWGSPLLAVLMGLGVWFGLSLRRRRQRP